MYDYSKKIRALFCLGLAVSLIACSSISKFDQYAYTQATSIKVDALNLMGHATENYDVHAGEVSTVQTTIDKMYEYEKNRPRNLISEKMWKVLSDSTGHLFGGFVRRWEREGKLDSAFVKESQVIVSQSSDQILQLESGKIKSTQITN